MKAASLNESFGYNEDDRIQRYRWYEICLLRCYSDNASNENGTTEVQVVSV